jgi:hypothetical protein
MGVALFRSRDPSDQGLWRDWHAFTAELALSGAFSAVPSEREMARAFIRASLEAAGRPGEPFSSRAVCREALDSLPASPDNVFFFEYNFLFVLAAGGRPEKSALGDHSAAGYAQRARFYAVSEEARLLYAKGVAGYLVFLAEHAGLAEPQRCAACRSLLARISTHAEFLDEISR